ncbi:MAG: ATP-binding protein [Bacteroidales bacterium]|nr:ATP-binding protein [Bacteroidales bacterium]
MEKFIIENFGLIKNVSISFGDLTLLVGPQASGKSIALETLKLAIDRDHIINTLDRYNYIIGHNTDKILNVYFGEGMSGIWKDNTHIEYDDISFLKKNLPKKADETDETLFYIPAQRIFSISDGRPKNFMEFDSSSPYILRSFSETLRLFMQNGMGQADVLFPIKNRLKGFLRRSFDDSIFHNAKIITEERAGQKKMILNVDDLSIPFMSWSAGQKEFMPLLLAFYCLSGPPSNVIKKEKYRYVVIEEPEMGLHPKAIISVILQILELIQTGGYKVIVSSHSPVFLEFAWSFNLLRSNPQQYEALYELFDIPEISPVKEMLAGLFDKSIRTYYFDRESKNGKVVSHDISSLDVTDTNNIVSNWGGLSEFSSKVSEVVSKYSIDYE